MTVSLDRVVSALADRYTVVRELGRGGMATVYLAEDLRHHRKVAIKVLKDDVSASVGGNRFLREIEIAAQLSHPHILPLLDSGDANGLLYYVMPYVEGQSLRQRLAREGELPVGDAVRIVVDVADALAYAHAHGVVHRDIKPDNIMLTGRHAVVADFGVARAVSQAVEGSSALTSLGVALGTPAYMAPEQAVADPHVDQRADIYALGVVAYELLAGRTPFTSASPQQMLAAHVTEKPDPPSRYRPGIAPALEKAVMRCLEKRAADRFQTADELLAVLEPLATPSGGTAPTAARLPVVPISSAFLRPRWIAGIAALIAIVALAGWQLTLRAPRTLELGRSTPLTSDPGLEIHPDISPDGKLVAYSAGTFARMRIYIRPVAGGRTIPLSDDTTSVEYAPKWSPDGSRILFLVRGGVSVAPALGGTTRPVIAPNGNDVGNQVRSADWSPDGTKILFVRGDSILEANIDGSAVTVVSNDARATHSCAKSPQSGLIACAVGNMMAGRPDPVRFGNLAASAIVMFSSRGGYVTRLTEDGFSNEAPAWSADGRLLFFISNRDGPLDVYAMSLSKSGSARGEPQRLTTGLGAVSISLAADGKRLAYATFAAQANLWTLPIPSRGVLTATGATALTSGNQAIDVMSVSPDGRWIVYDSNLGGLSHIWRIPVAGGQPQQLTNGPAHEFGGQLSPDGQMLAYQSFRRGSRDIEVLPLSGGEPEFVTNTPEQEMGPHWSRDGRSIFFRTRTVNDDVSPTRFFVTTRQTNGGWSVPRLIGTSITYATHSVSPDNTFIAVTERPGRIVLIPVAGGEPREIHAAQSEAPAPVSTRWGSDGRIYFKAFDKAGRASFWSMSSSGGAPRLLVRFDDLSKPSGQLSFAIDGQRFYFTIQDRQSDIYTVDITRK